MLALQPIQQNHSLCVIFGSATMQRSVAIFHVWS